MPLVRDKVDVTNWYNWDGNTWGAWSIPTYCAWDAPLCAWTVDDTVYYTESATPAVGDKVYNEAKEDSGYTVKAVSGSTITIG